MPFGGAPYSQALIQVAKLLLFIVILPCLKSFSKFVEMKLFIYEQNRTLWRSSKDITASMDIIQ